MTIPTTFSNLSTTPSANSPAGSDAASSIDDNIRVAFAFIGSIYANTATNGWTSPYLPTSGGTVSGNLTVSGTLTGSTGLMNIGAGQVYKDDSGNVGLGTTSPATYGKLVVAHPSTGQVVAVGITTGGGGNNLVGTVLFPNGYGVTNSAKIKAWCGSTSLHSFLSFDVSGTEALRVDQSRNLLIGYTTSNGSYSLQVNSQIFATSSTVATSDGRYKTAVSGITDALGVVNALRPVSFEWLPHQVHKFPAGRTTGFIAQEVQSALSGKPYADAIVKTNSTELPDGTTEEFLGIAEGNLIAILTRAVQELSAQSAALSAQSATLSDHIADLSARVVALE